MNKIQKQVLAGTLVILALSFLVVPYEDHEGLETHGYSTLFTPQKYTKSFLEPVSGNTYSINNLTSKVNFERIFLQSGAVALLGSGTLVLTGLRKSSAQAQDSLPPKAKEAHKVSTLQKQIIGVTLIMLALSLIIVPYDDGYRNFGYSTLFTPIDGTKLGGNSSKITFEKVLLQDAAFLLIGSAAFILAGLRKTV